MKQAVREWFVVFEPTTSAWWGRFLKEGFGHCYAFGLDVQADRWVAIEPLFEHVRVDVLDGALVDWFWRRAMAGELRILKVPVQDVAYRRPRFLVTCAGCVASLIGLRRYPLTPWGLFWMVRRLPGVQEIHADGKIAEVQWPLRSRDSGAAAGAGDRGPPEAGRRGEACV